jgi:hypothetical protein
MEESVVLEVPFFLFFLMIIINNINNININIIIIISPLFLFLT